MYLERNQRMLNFGFLSKFGTNDDIFVFNDYSDRKAGLWHLKYDKLPSMDIVTSIREIVAQRTIKKNEEKSLSLEKIHEILKLLQSDLNAMKVDMARQKTLITNF